MDDDQFALNVPDLQEFLCNLIPERKVNMLV